jgi:hypothetical protein
VDAAARSARTPRRSAARRLVNFSFARRAWTSSTAWMAGSKPVTCHRGCAPSTRRLATNTTTASPDSLPNAAAPPGRDLVRLRREAHDRLHRQGGRSLGSPWLGRAPPRSSPRTVIRPSPRDQVRDPSERGSRWVQVPASSLVVAVVATAIDPGSVGSSAVTTPRSLRRVAKYRAPVIRSAGRPGRSPSR